MSQQLHSGQESLRQVPACTQHPALLHTMEATLRALAWTGGALGTAAQSGQGRRLGWAQQQAKVSSNIAALMGFWAGATGTAGVCGVLALAVANLIFLILLLISEGCAV